MLIDGCIPSRKKQPCQSELCSLDWEWERHLPVPQPQTGNRKIATKLQTSVAEIAIALQVVQSNQLVINLFLPNKLPQLQWRLKMTLAELIRHSLCHLIWMPGKVRLFKSGFIQPRFNTSSRGVSQAQTNVLSRISYNSCWEELTETQSFATRPCYGSLPAISLRRVRGIWIQSAVWKYASGTISLWCKFTESIPLLTHVVVLQIIASLCDISAYLTVAFLFLWWRRGSTETSFLMDSLRMDVVWESKMFKKICKLWLSKMIDEQLFQFRFQFQMIQNNGKFRAQQQGLPACSGLVKCHMG